MGARGVKEVRKKAIKSVRKLHIPDGGFQGGWKETFSMGHLSWESIVGDLATNAGIKD